MHGKIQPVILKIGALFQYPVNGVDGAELGRAQCTNHLEDRDLPPVAAIQGLCEMVHVHAHVIVGRDLDQVLRAEARQLHAFCPGIMGRGNTGP